MSLNNSYYSQNEIIKLSGLSRSKVYQVIKKAKEENAIGENHKSKKIKYEKNKQGKSTPVYNRDATYYILSKLFNVAQTEVDNELFLLHDIHDSIEDYEQFNAIDNSIYKLNEKIPIAFENDFANLKRQIKALKKTIIDLQSDVKSKEDFIQDIYQNVEMLENENLNIKRENDYYIGRLQELDKINANTEKILDLLNKK